MIPQQLTFFPPWINAPLAALADLRPQMPHALLLYGQAGIGKRSLGTALARGLLCEATSNEAIRGAGCGACPACAWFAQGSHPDFRSITSEALAVAAGAELAEDGEAAEAEVTTARSKRAPSKEIKVDQIRALQPFMSVATHRGRSRVVLLDPLEAVNEIAVNALLKMLEEPPPQTVFILVADHLGRIPATIVSRCQKVAVPSPGHDAAVAWLAAQGIPGAEALLALAGGAPLAALALAKDADSVSAHDGLVGFLSRPGVDAALAAAESFARTPAGPLIRWMQQWLADCIGMRLAARIRYHPAQSKVIARLADHASLDALTGLMQRLDAIRRTVDHPLNTRLMMEGLLLAYADAMVPAQASSDTTTIPQHRPDPNPR